MSTAPVNTFLPRPAAPTREWTAEEPKWIELNNAVNGNRAFYPLTVKAFYVIGLILAACRSVSILLHDQMQFDTTYFPAYAVFSSAMDLFGRCLRGDRGTRGTTGNLTAALQWLSLPDIQKYKAIQPNTTLLSTENASYSIETLVSFRNFSAHGQAMSSDKLPAFDYLILGRFPPLLSRGMEAYWALLQQAPAPCELLAAAMVTPYRNRPLFDTLWSFKGSAEHPYPPIGDIFGKLNWDYSPPPIRSSAA